MNKVKVLYVYYGTPGLAGAYIHGIAQSMQAVHGIECHLAVNWYYRFPGLGSKVTCPFFPLTELDGENRFLHFPGMRYLRLPIRYIELVAAYLYLMFYVVMQRIDVVNLSLIDDEIPTALFAIGVKVLGKQLFVTAHDSIPYGTRSSIGRRRYVFNLADKVIVHYEHVKQSLAEHFGVPPSKVFLHSYPLSDVDVAIDQTEHLKHLQNARQIVAGFRRTFLFIGVLRPQKGLSDLADAWRRARSELLKEGCLLLVAGRPVPGLDVGEVFDGLPNVRLIDRYLEAEEFWAFLTVANVVVLPYAVSYYAHSAVVLMSFLASKCVVASDIPLFEWLVDNDVGYRFTATDVDDLARVLVQVSEETDEEIRHKGEMAKQHLEAERARLPGGLAELYSPS
jgi:glycosyltransferase involved in cell wall biosynthesis